MAHSYDRIARFYDVDMARNMAFDDVGFYAARCLERPGRALELGCGNGRILLALLAAGCAAVGVDASSAMLGELVRKAMAGGRADPPVCCMDVRALAFEPAFATVLLPYSLVTYLFESDLARTLAEVRAVLEPGGRAIVDAFVPKPVGATAAFVRDYRRAYPGGELERWKRITALTPTRNRIERRYLDFAPGGELRETIDVEEIIRPYALAELAAALDAAGFEIERTWWDYADGRAAPSAQFVSVSARAKPSR